MNATQRLLISYGLGAASPSQIAHECTGLCESVFVFDGCDAHSLDVRPLLEQLGETLDVAALGFHAVVRRAREARVAGVTTFSEKMLPFTCRLATALELPFHSAEAVRRLTAKDVQRSALAAAEIPGPACVLVETSDEAMAALRRVGVPAVLKPQRGSGSVRTIAIESEGELERIAEEVGLGKRVDGVGRGFVLEQRLEGAPHPAAHWLGDYVSVETIASGGRYRHVCVADKPPLAWPFRERGMVLPTSAPSDLIAELCTLTDSALRACGVELGATHTEIKLTPEGPRVLEVNGRLGGSVHRLIERVSPIRPIRLAIEAAVGMEPAFVADFRALSVQYIVPAPPSAGRIIVPPDPRRLLSIPGVYNVDGRLPPGAPLDWRAGTLGSVCTVWAEVDGLNDARRIFEATDRVVAETAAFA